MTIRRTVLAVLLSAVALGGAATATATAAPSRTVTATRAAAASAKLAAAPDPGSTDKCTDGFGGVSGIVTDLPAAPCFTFPGATNTRWTDSVLPFDPVTQNVPKAKITFNFPELLVRGYVLVCFNSVQTTLCPNAKLPDFTTFPYNFFAYYGKLWVVSPQGTDPHYGVFPPVRVSTLAFGSIPVTATVNIEQVPGSDGYRTPLSLQWVSGSNLSGNITIPGYEKYGPPPQDGGLYQFYAAPDIKGEVSIRLSDVTVDGIPVDVGSSCQTETSLTLTAAAGYLLTNADPVEGQPGEYTPQGASYLHGSVDVPAFHGCRNGNEDLDPLITATVSGKGNHIDAHQTTSLNVTGCYNNVVDGCADLHPQFPKRSPSNALAPQGRAKPSSSTSR